MQLRHWRHVLYICIKFYKTQYLTHNFSVTSIFVVYFYIKFMYNKYTRIFITGVARLRACYSRPIYAMGWASQSMYANLLNIRFRQLRSCYFKFDQYSRVSKEFAWIIDMIFFSLDFKLMYPAFIYMYMYKFECIINFVKRVTQICNEHHTCIQFYWIPNLLE